MSIANEDDEPCPGCVNAGECGDGTWICLQFSGYLEDGSFFVATIDLDTD